MKKGSKRPSVSYHKKPEDLSVDSWQLALRRQIAADQSFEIKKLSDEHPVFADYLVRNPLSGGEYKVAIRSQGFGLNFCTCPDFKTNWLGTCKHIETIIASIKKNKNLRLLLSEGFTPSYSSIFLKYGQKQEVMLRIGTENRSEFEILSKDYFDHNYCLKPDAYDRIHGFIKKAAGINPHFRCYDDTLAYIISVREANRRRKVISEKLNKDPQNSYFNTLLKTAIYPYQKEGIIFAVKAGRSLIADEMGLGKTLQAIGAAEVFRKEFKIQNTVIVCPTSLKYQWKSEIEKFTGSEALVIEGKFTKRKKQYGQDCFYKIASYNAVATDWEEINSTHPDLILLDEAQRIKNWKTQTAQTVKRLVSDYALVLTGTPIENRLEELYSIIQFIDPYKLGPLYKFLEEHEIKDENGKVAGYRNLKDISRVLSEIVIRRRKKEVLSQLPERTDKNLFVPLTVKQSQVHDEYAQTVSRLINKWKRLGFLDEKDRQILLLSLNCMRMVSDSTYILDQETRFDTKITELMSILDDVFEVDGEKVVVFSQWERMTRLVAKELDLRTIGYEYLHGGVPSKDRKDLISNFHRKKESRVFLSTDAGGLGLNLQCASLLINLDIPWNPAVLEQRIGRIHRIGQKNNINVINLISKESIEERILGLLKFKSSLFAGVLDDGQDRIFMGEGRFKKFMRSVEEVSCTSGFEGESEVMEETRQPSLFPASEGQGQSPAELFSTASEFFGKLSQAFSNAGSSEDLVSSIMEKDPVTGKQYLKIPVENEETVVKTINAIGSIIISLFKK